MNLCGALAVGAALLWAGTAHAQGFDYDCDTPSARFSAVQAPARTGAQSISGSITVHALYSADRYLSAGLAMIQRSGKDGWWVQLGITAKAADDKERLTGVLRVKGPGDATPQSYEIGVFRFGDGPIPFQLTLDANGAGRAQLGGGKALTFTLPAGQESRASLTCSTGDFLFSGVSFGG